LIPKTGVAPFFSPRRKKTYRVFGDKLGKYGREVSRESAGLTMALGAF